MWSSNLFLCIQLFPKFFIVQVFQSPGFSWSRFFKVQIFLNRGPGFRSSLKSNYISPWVNLAFIVYSYFIEAASRGLLWKKVKKKKFLKILQNSQENASVRAYFLIKLQDVGEIFKNSFFTEHLQTTASDFLPFI